MDRHQRIGILLSGQPGQRELSLRQGEAISTALARLGHTPVPVFLDGDLDLLIRQANLDAAFIATQGRFGADGCVQGLLEIMGVPYTGSGVLAAALASDLLKTKEILRFHNLPTTPGYVYDGLSGDSLIERHGSFGYPVTVRPVGEASALPVNVAYDELDLESFVEDALRCDDRVLIERHMPGRQLWVGVLDNAPLGAVEAGHNRASRPVVSASRGRGASPGRLPEERLRSVLRLATMAYEALGCEGAVCVRVQVSERGNEIVREVDPSPSLTQASPLSRIAKTAGLDFEALTARILAGARLRAHGKRENRRHVQVQFDGPERRRNVISHAH